MQHEADCAAASDADIRSGQAIPTAEMQTCKTENDEKWPWRVQYVAMPCKQPDSHWNQHLGPCYPPSVH